MSKQEESAFQQLLRHMRYFRLVTTKYQAAMLDPAWGTTYERWDMCRRYLIGRYGRETFDRMRTMLMRLEPPASDQDEFQRLVGRWGETTRPDARRWSIMLRLHEELRELDGAIERLFRARRTTESGPAEEAADCYLLLLQIAHREGFSLHEAAQRKHATNTLPTPEGPA